jgi:NAD(P)-dependent dehydrogenase (short-subunit alcohol dehydrogenase family)
VDLMDFEKVEIAFKKIVESFGTIDILVNNAGVSYGNSSEKYSIDDWNKTIGVNLTVPFNMSKMVANELIKKEKSGSIINITSLGAEFGFPENPAYCASKGGLKQLTKALAYDWAKYGIRVNNVGPGYMHTNMTDKSYNNPQMNAERLRHMMIQRWGEPRDLAGVCVFLASQMSEYITGQDIYVDGGWTAKGL